MVGKQSPTFAKQFSFELLNHQNSIYDTNTSLRKAVDILQSYIIKTPANEKQGSYWSFRSRSEGCGPPTRAAPFSFQLLQKKEATSASPPQKFYFARKVIEHNPVSTQS